MGLARLKEMAFRSFAWTARSRFTVSPTGTRTLFSLMIFMLLACAASPVMAETQPAATWQDLNAWLVLGVIAGVLAAGLFLQSTTRRIR